MFHSEPENKKKSPGKKKIVKSNKSISRKNFLTKFHNQFLNWEKVKKLPEMQFHEKKFDLFDFTSFFFACTFLNFLAQHCAARVDGDVLTLFSIIYGISLRLEPSGM